MPSPELSAEPASTCAGRSAKWCMSARRWCWYRPTTAISPRMPPAAVMVEYDPLPVAADCVAALEPGSPLRASPTHPQSRGRDDCRIWRRGCAPSLPARAPVPAHASGFIAAAAIPWNVAGWSRPTTRWKDRLTVWSSTQMPHAARRFLCDMLGLGERQIRVVDTRCRRRLRPQAGLLSRGRRQCHTLPPALFRRPVKWIEDRQEHFVATTQERDQYLGRRTRDRRATASSRACAACLIHDHGAWTARGVNVPQGAVSAMPLALSGAKLPHGHQGRRDQQGAGDAGARRRPAARRFRHGAADGRGARRRWALDRAEIRRRNLGAGRTHALRHPDETRGGIPVVLDSGDYPRCMQTALDGADWAGFAARRAAAPAGQLLGIGVANYVEGTGRGPYRACLGTHRTLRAHLLAADRRGGDGTKHRHHARPDRRRSNWAAISPISRSSAATPWRRRSASADPIVARR